MEQIHIKKWISIDKEFRDRTSYSWSYDWKSERVETLLSSHMDTMEIIHIVGLSTFHPNGYFREKALDYLMGIHHPTILPYIMIRCNDWVNVISKKASDYLYHFINRHHLKNIFQYFTLFMHINKFQRNDVKYIGSKFEKLMKHPQIINTLFSCLEHGDVLGRRFIIYRLAHNPSVDYKQLMDVFFKESDMRVQGYTIDRILKRLPDDYLLNKQAMLLNAKFYQVRVSAIREMYVRKLIHKPEMLLFSLMDKHEAVREIGRYFLEQMGYNDFIQFYWKRLKANPKDDIAILGLTDVATHDQIPQLKQLLISEKPKVVRKLLRCLTTLDFAQCKKELLFFLEDSRIGVSNEAKRMLMAHSHLIDLEGLYKIIGKTDREYVMINAGIIICHSHQWEALSYMIKLSIHQSQVIAHIAKEGMHKWKRRYNPYKKPTQEQLLETDQTVNKYQSLLNQEFIQWYHFITKVYRH